MRLDTRLSLSFLGTLALILVGFSAALYLAAAKHLHRQVDERLEAVINTLAAAAEVNEDSVEWEPAERRLSFGRRTEAGSLAWVVRNSQGRTIDRSAPGMADPDPAGWMRLATGRPHRVADAAGRPWQVLARKLEGAGSGSSQPGTTPPEPSDGIDPTKPEVGPSRALVLGAAISLAEVGDTLRTLASVLILLSTGTWTICLLVGGRLVRRALRPVAAMAEVAHAIAGHSFDERVPTPASGDELEELGRAFNGLLDRHYEAHERQRRFTGDASHQLRTPLTALQGQVDLALRHPRSVEEYQRVLAVIQAKTRHLRRIVEALLFLARADGESHRPPLERVELTAWLRDHLTARIGPWTHTIRFEPVDLTANWVEVDSTLLGELVANLLDNACKYSAPGTLILVRAIPSGASVRLSVTDQGIGIDPTEVPHVTIPFYRTDSARRRDGQGLGLGLYVASRIARLFGGHLEVASRPGAGTTVSVVLPGSKPVAGLEDTVRMK